MFRYDGRLPYWKCSYVCSAIHEGHKGIRHYSLLIDNITLLAEIRQELSLMIGTEDLLRLHAHRVNILSVHSSSSVFTWLFICFDNLLTYEFYNLKMCEFY